MTEKFPSPPPITHKVTVLKIQWKSGMTTEFPMPIGGRLSFNAKPAFEEEGDRIVALSLSEEEMK